MKSLADILLASHHKDALIIDVAALLERHVQSRRGLKGLLMKAGLSLLKSTRPDIAQRASNRLLPEMLHALEPLYRQFRKSSDGDFAVFLSKNAESASGALLAVADTRIANSGPTARSTYQQFRSGADEEVRLLLPALGKLFSSYIA